MNAEHTDRPIVESVSSSSLSSLSLVEACVTSEFNDSPKHTNNNNNSNSTTTIHCQSQLSPSSPFNNQPIDDTSTTAITSNAINDMEKEQPSGCDTNINIHTKDDSSTVSCSTSSNHSYCNNSDSCDDDGVAKNRCDQIARQIANEVNEQQCSSIDDVKCELDQSHQVNAANPNNYNNNINNNNNNKSSNNNNNINSNNKCTSNDSHDDGSGGGGDDDVDDDDDRANRRKVANVVLKIDEKTASPSNSGESICDVVTTVKDIRNMKHVQGRSNSTGKLYQASRRVSFPENDSELVTGYLEPANPWASG